MSTYTPPTPHQPHACSDCTARCTTVPNAGPLAPVSSRGLAIDHCVQDLAACTRAAGAQTRCSTRCCLCQQPLTPAPYSHLIRSTHTWMISTASANDRAMKPSASTAGVTQRPCRAALGAKAACSSLLTGQHSRGHNQLLHLTVAA